MRMLLSVFMVSALILSGCGNNKGKVEKDNLVPPDPNLKPAQLNPPPLGGAPAGKTK